MGNQKTQWSTKKSVAPVQQNKGTYPYPSRFGTHACMVLERKEELGLCLCEDEFGTYETEIKKIDNGQADPNRYLESRLGKLLGGRQTKEE